MRTDSVNLAIEAVREIRAVDRAALRRRGAARRAAHLQDEVEERAGGARGHATDLRGAHARAAHRQARCRRAPALHADLATRGREPDGGGGVRHRGRRPRRRPRPDGRDPAPVPRQRLDAGQPGLPRRVPRKRGRRRLRRRKRPHAARHGDRRQREAARGETRAAFHRAAAALLRGEPGQGARGARHRPAVDLREHHPDAAVQEVLRAHQQALHAHRPGQDRQPLPHRQLRALRRLRLHRRDGGRARQHLARRGGLGAGARALLGAARASRSRTWTRTSRGRTCRWRASSGSIPPPASP